MYIYTHAHIYSTYKQYNLYQILYITTCTNYITGSRKFLWIIQVARLAMLSLLAVFKDILPGYRIRLPTEKELEIPVSKEVKQTRDYESMQVRLYQVDPPQTWVQRLAIMHSRVIAFPFGPFYAQMLPKGCAFPKRSKASPNS